MNRLRLMRILYGGLIVASFTIGTIGYLMAGETWYDASYYTLQLFVLNYVFPARNNGLIYVARVLCPFATLTGLFTMARGAFKILGDTVVAGMRDATAVYYDDKQTEKIAKGFRHVVLAKRELKKRVRSHVLMLPTDKDNLDFYVQIEKKLRRNSKVYMKLDNMDSKLLEKSNIHYFNVNEMIARLYWQERNLKNYLVDGRLEAKIAVLGFGMLGSEILNYGLMNNIYSDDQSISYHIWGDSLLYREMLKNLDTMNGDSLVFHDTEWKNEIHSLREFERIIIASEPDIELLQALQYLDSDVEIDFYNPDGLLLEQAYEGNRLKPFGILSEVLTEENIKTDKLYRTAKMLNYNYVVMYDTENDYTWNRRDIEKVMEEKWRELSGFVKGSNMAAVDYHKIRLMVMEVFGVTLENLTEKQREQLSKMEHIRWSRYHYVNHWGYAPERDNRKRKHPLLVPFEELSTEEKDKDMEVIHMLMELEMRCDR